MKKNIENEIEVIVEYSNKRINKVSLAGLFYDIMEKNLREGVNYDTEEDSCA